MDPASGAFAVVSLAIQLVETSGKISKFFADVRDAPSEFTQLGETVNQLNSALKDVHYHLELQYQIHRLPGSPAIILTALQSCEKRIKTLEDVIQKKKSAMDHRKRLHRSVAAIQFVLKKEKEEIRELQSQLRDAHALLQTAMMNTIWQLQYLIQVIDLGECADH